MNIDIDGMSNQEKSVMLARLCGWLVTDEYFHSYHPPSGQGASVNHTRGYSDIQLFKKPFCMTLYEPANMELAKKVIEWGIENKPTYKNFVETNALAAWAKPAGVRVLLDELALYALTT